MIHIDISDIQIPDEWVTRSETLTTQLASLTAGERKNFIDDNRDITWGANELRDALSALVGHKCWYTEVGLEGADPHVDHFRPKGAVREVDENLKNTKKSDPGYWWLAFELENYRLTCQHANVRRVDRDTDGGKWDYFPVDGNRAPDNTPTPQITERKLILDPTSNTDVQLLWFDKDGSPSCSATRSSNHHDRRRVDTTIWIYHLKKKEIKAARSKVMHDIKKDVVTAHPHFSLWDRDNPNPSEQAKNAFDSQVAIMRSKIRDTEKFAGAKRCMLKNLFATNSKYHWIEEFVLS